MIRVGRVVFALISSSFFLSQPIASQEVYAPITNKNKGQFYVFWGWNQAEYTRSAISFVGEDYSFTLKKVKATDRQTRLSSTYVKLGTATIPQYNFRVGYFISDHLSVSIGNDHMKYIVVQNQTVEITGKINGTGGFYDSDYNHDEVKLTEDFLKFEHTDGLNYENVDFRYHYNWLESKKLSLTVMEGIGAGIMLPKTNSTLLGKDRNDEFHLAGFGLNALFALSLKHKSGFFIQSEAKGGYINMPDIRTTKDKVDKAAQDFFFFQYNVVLGYQFGKGRS